MRQVLLVAFLAGVAQAYAGQPDAKVVIGNARFTVIAPECIRIEYTNDAKFVDAKSMFAVGRDAAWNDFKLSRDGNDVVIDTGKIRLRYCSDGRPFTQENLHAQIARGEDWVDWWPGEANQGNLGGTIRTLDGVKGPVELDDGVLSRDGWYLLDDSQSPLMTADWVQERPENGSTDWYLFGYGTDYKAGLRALTRIGGSVPLPRKYVLGAWYSRYWHYTAQDFRDIVEEYCQHDFPLDVIVMDMDWHLTRLPGSGRAGQIWTGYTWDRGLIPDPEGLLQWFHQQGLHVTLNDHPADGVQPHEQMYEDFMKAMGADPSTGQTLPFDAGDKKYLDTFFHYTHDPFEKEGVDFWWLDWQQFPYTRSLPHLTNLAWLNEYYYRRASRDDARGQSFSRWAGWGDHRHPIHFSGDADTGWNMLAFEVPFTSTAGNVGCFFWSHDIGGHMGGRNEESYTRWVQFGATSAALRSHSTRAADMDRRPWTYSKQAEDSMRISFHLRSELFPYIYSSVRESCTESVPLNRPMYIEYPGKEEAYHNPQEYFFGDNLLVAPITSPGEGPDKVAQQTVWFPPGEWYDWFTGQHFSGERTETASADINRFPLYARGGVPIPLQPYTQRMTTAALTDLVVRCYPGDDGQSASTTLYEDDGVTTGYLKGEWSQTVLTYRRLENKVTVIISPSKDSYPGQVEKRSYHVELCETAKPRDVVVRHGQSETDYSTDYDESTHTVHVRIAPRPIHEDVTVLVNF
jgi:alpha-glucosidase (family GH31 glycosyl hydrolase)